jgi:hypothetical protein
LALAGDSTMTKFFFFRAATWGSNQDSGLRHQVSDGSGRFRSQLPSDP